MARLGHGVFGFNQRQSQRLVVSVQSACLQLFCIELMIYHKCGADTTRTDVKQRWCCVSPCEWGYRRPRSSSRIPQSPNTQVSNLSSSRQRTCHSCGDASVHDWRRWRSVCGFAGISLYDFIMQNYVMVLHSFRYRKNQKYFILIHNNIYFQEFVEYVTQMFLCIICQEVAVTPVTTPCLHNFCLVCWHYS